MIEWLQMGGYGYYVWMSYGMLALAIAAEIVSLRRHRRDCLRRATDMRAEYRAQRISGDGEVDR